MNEHQKKIKTAFEIWWHNEGSAMPPKSDEDREEHMKRIAEIAFLNGGYKAVEYVVEDLRQL